MQQLVRAHGIGVVAGGGHCGRGQDRVNEGAGWRCKVYFIKCSLKNKIVLRNWKSAFFFFANPWPSSLAMRYQT